MAKHHHLVIAGTGRAGTSFLVRYLAAAGLDTILSRQGEKAFWSEEARAGFEDHTLARGDLAQCPYVVKSPWLYEHVEEFFGRDDVQIDGLVLPIRALEYAACSRVILELQAVHRAGRFPTEKAWGSFGVTPGGLHISLDPIDQARLLATGFHKVVEAAVRLDVPVTLLDFTRLTEDARYLFEKLRPYLPASLSAEEAALIHGELAKGETNRTEDELAAYVEGANLRMPPPTALDNAALKREMTRAFREVQEQRTALQQQADAHREALARKEAEHNDRVAALEGKAASQSATVTGQSETIAELEQKIASGSATAAAQVEIIADLERQLAAQLAALEHKDVELQQTKAELEGRTIALQEAVAAAERQSAFQASAIINQSNELASARAEADELSARLKATGLALEKLRQREQELLAETTNAAQCRQDLRAARERINALVGSTSWRVTAPLRFLRRALSLTSRSRKAQ